MEQYRVYVRIIDIKEIGKTVFTWLVSREGMPTSINSAKGTGPDCGGTVINNKSLESAVKEMNSQISHFLTPGEVSYTAATPPWEGDTAYKDTYGLTPILEKLNQRGKKND